MSKAKKKIFLYFLLYITLLNNTLKSESITIICQYAFVSLAVSSIPNMVFIGQDILDEKNFFSPTIGKNFILNVTTNFLPILGLYLLNKNPGKSVNNLLIATAITTLLSVGVSSFFLKQRLNNYINTQNNHIKNFNENYIKNANIFFIDKQEKIISERTTLNTKNTRLKKIAHNNWLNAEEITNLKLEITKELCTQNINLPFLKGHFDKIIIDNDQVTAHINKIISDYLEDKKYSQEEKLELLYTIPLDFKLSKIVTVHLENYFNSMIDPNKISEQYTLLNKIYNENLKNTLLKNNLLNNIIKFMKNHINKGTFNYNPEAMLSYVKTILNLCNKNKANKEFETDIFFADPVKAIYKDYYQERIVTILNDYTSSPITSESSLAPLRAISEVVVNEKKYLATVGCDERVISSEINKSINQVIENIKEKADQGFYDNIAWEDIVNICNQVENNWIMKLYAPITALFLQRIYFVNRQNIYLQNIFNECDKCFNDIKNSIKKIKLENNNKANDIIVSLHEQIMNFTQLCKKFMQYYNTYTIDNKDLMRNKSNALKECKENFLSNIINQFKYLLYTYSYEKKTTLLEQILMFYIQNTDNSDYENKIIKPLKTFDEVIPEKQSFPTHYSEELEECIRFYTRYNQLKYSEKNGNLSDYDIFAFINWIEASHLIQMYPQENYNKKIEEFKTNNNQFKTLFEMYKNKIDTNISENIKKKLATVMYGGPIDSGFYQEIIKRWMLYIEKSNQKNITEESKKHHSIFLNLLQYFKLNNDFHVKIKKNGPNNTIDHKDMFRFNIERYIAQNILQAQSEKDDVFKRMTILYNIISGKDNYSQKHTKNILSNIFHRNNKFFTLATNEDIEIIIKYLAVFYPEEKSLQDLNKMLIILKENIFIKNFILKIYENLDCDKYDKFFSTCTIYITTLNKFLSEKSTEAFIELIEALHNQNFYDPVKKDLHGHKIILTDLKFELINDIVMLGNEKKVFENESFQEYREIFTIKNNNNITLSHALLFYIYKKSIKNDLMLFKYLFPDNIATIYNITTMKNLIDLQDAKNLLTYLSKKSSINTIQENNEDTLKGSKKEYMMQDNSQEDNEDTLTVSKKEAKNNNSNNNNPDLEKQKNYLQLYVNLYDNTITVQKIFHNISDAFFNSMVKKNTIQKIIETKIWLNMKLDKENNTFYNILFKDLLHCGDKLLCLLLNSMVFDNYNTAMKFTNIYYHPPFSEYKKNGKPEPIITSDKAFLLFSYIKKNDVSIFLKTLNETLENNKEGDREEIIKELLCILKNNNIKEETNFTHNTDFDHKVLYPIKKHHIIIKDILKIYNNPQHGNSTYYKNAYTEEERNEIKNCISLLPKQKNTNNDVLPVNNKNDNNNEKRVVFYTEEIKKAHLANELRIIDKIIKFYLIDDKEFFKKHVLFSKICHLLEEEKIKNNPHYSIMPSIINFQKENIDKFGLIDHAKYLNDDVNVSLLCKTMVDLSEANYRVIVKLSLKKPHKEDMQAHITELQQHIEYFTNLKNNTHNIFTQEMPKHIKKYKEYHSLKNVILAFFYDTYFYVPAKSFFIAMTNKIKDQLIDINAFHEEEVEAINNEIDYAKHYLNKTEDSRNAFLFHLYLTNKILLNKILEYCKNNIDENNINIIKFYRENINEISLYKLPYNIRKNIYYESNRDKALTCTVLDSLNYDLHSFQNIKKNNSTWYFKNQWSKKNDREEKFREGKFREEKFIVEYNFSKNNNNISLLNTDRKKHVLRFFNNLFSSEKYFIIKDPYLIRFDIKKISHHLTDSLLKNEVNKVTLVQLGLQREDITNFFIDIFAKSDPEKSFALRRPTKNSYLHFANKITITKNLNDYKINIGFFHQKK